MPISVDATYEKEYNCLTSDLVGGFPSTTVGFKSGSIMYAVDATTKKLVKIFKLIGGVWYLFYEV